LGAAAFGLLVRRHRPGHAATLIVGAIVAEMLWVEFVARR